MKNHSLVEKAGPFWRWDVPANSKIITKARLTSEVNQRRKAWLDYWLEADQRFRMFIFGYFFFGTFLLIMAKLYDAPPYNGMVFLGIGAVQVALRVYLVSRTRRRTHAIFA